MNIKSCGQKNELTADEKRTFESLLKGKFTIFSQIGRSGARTSAYMMSDENGCHYVLKIPNDNDNKDWLISQQKTYKACDNVLRNYHGNVYIPKMILQNENYIVENYAGEELSSHLYTSALSEYEQKTAANELASLLFKLHNDNPVGITTPIQMMTVPAFNDIYEYMLPAMNQIQQNMFQIFIQKLIERDTSDELSVMTHGDLRSQNILYDKEKKRLAVIDFELLGSRNIYHDFVPFAAASFGMPYGFLWDTIDAYNSLSGRKAIEKEKVRLLHCAGILHEIGRCASYAACHDGELHSRCQNAFERVSNVLL